jgi:hypothetical protein
MIGKSSIEFDWEDSFFETSEYSGISSYLSCQENLFSISSEICKILNGAYSYHIIKIPCMIDHAIIFIQSDDTCAGLPLQEL